MESKLYLRANIPNIAVKNFSIPPKYEINQSNLYAVLVVI